VRHVVVGTAGHIDHGKTSLVKALTGTDTDRLPEEKARGITIDLGFAFLEEPDGLVIEIVDVPGHERFVKNMLAGAGGIDLALLVVAADEGVMPQTREHLAICQLLRIKSGLVVLSACETSRGRLLPGEGVLGPAQAFLAAGAAAVVASYWRVDDLATSKFMQVFYRYLLAERLPAATALRRAQLETAATSTSHDWAAFSLYGWPDSSI